MERARPVIFYRPDCQKSKRALAYLEARKVPYTAIEIKEDEASVHRLQHATGQKKTPALVHEHENLHDFNLPELASFLKKYQLDEKRGAA